MSQSIEINLKSFPKHKVRLLENGVFTSQMEVDCGWELSKEIISTGSVFDDIRMKKMLGKVKDLFEPTKITIVGK